MGIPNREDRDILFDRLYALNDRARMDVLACLFGWYSAQDSDVLNKIEEYVTLAEQNSDRNIPQFPY